MMGYFSNGSEGDAYWHTFCKRCVHGQSPCPVWDAHYLYNYEECNNENSILHILIPLGDDGSGPFVNGKCTMFIPAEHETAKGTQEAE